MGRRVRAFDWSRTPLGPIDFWSVSLKTAVGICLNSPIAAFVWWGPDLINIYNDAYIPVLGARHPDALGRPAREIWSELWPTIGDEVDGVVLRGESVIHRRVLLTLERNGYPEETYFTYSHSPIPNDEGGIGGLFQLCAEETAQVFAERKLKSAEGQRQLALDAARLGWWRFDPIDNVASWDERYAEIFDVTGPGRSNDEMLARIDPEDLPGVLGSVAQALDPVDPKPYAAEYRIRRGDGSVRWIEAHGGASFEGEGTGRRAISLVGTVADVTERKRAEENLRRSETELRAQVEESIRFNRAAVGRELRIIEMKKEVNELCLSNGQSPRYSLDFERERIDSNALSQGEEPLTEMNAELERRIDDLRDSRRAALNLMEDAVRSRELAAESEELVRRANAALEERVLERTRELQEAVRELEGFTYSIAHDLRAPLRNIVGRVNITEEDFGSEMPAEALQNLAGIEKSAITLGNLVDDLLQFSRLGRREANREPIDLTEIAESVIAGHLTEFRGNGEVYVAPGMVGLGDRALLSMVLENLIGNALKYSKPGIPNRVEVGWTTPAEGPVVYHVRDQGIGFPQELAEKTFLPFERLHRRADFPGSGIGLANVRRIVEKHRGRVWAESEEGKGSTFFFTLE